jgi:hypothetical protein
MPHRCVATQDDLGRALVELVIQTGEPGLLEQARAAFAAAADCDALVALHEQASVPAEAAEHLDSFWQSSRTPTCPRRMRRRPRRMTRDQRDSPVGITPVALPLVQGGMALGHSR